MEKNLIIEATDFYGDCLNDSAGNKSLNEKRGPKGYVEIFEMDENKQKKLLGKENLVVYCGREWLIERAFNAKNENITHDETEYICWFGVGDSGCPIGDPLVPTSPTNLDTDLSNPVMINDSDAACSDHRVSPDIGYYKHPFDSLTFEQDPENGNCWLIIRVSTTLGMDDANGFNLSEAGLYTASSDQGGYIGPFNLYARITFPTIVKDSTRELLFVWYVYF